MYIYKQVILTLLPLKAIDGADPLKFQVKKNFGPSKTIQKRSSSNEMLFEITNQQDYYSLDVAIGSSNESISALLDTGSSDMWILGTNYTGDIPFTYKNLPSVMKDHGLIDRVAYSLFLNSSKAESGELLFGAIDSSKFIGNLNSIPLINTQTDYYNKTIEFDITLQGVGFVSENGKATTLNTQYFAALADSGTTYLNVPQDLGDLMAAQVGATYDVELGYYTLSCPNEKAVDKSAFVFQFGGENYFFPYRDFVIATSDDNTCVLGITRSDSQHVILGDNILSSLYVVYDLEKYELSFARANHAGADSVDASNIISMPSIPGFFSSVLTRTDLSNTWESVIDSITSGGDIFSGSKTVSNPWATTSTKYTTSATYTTLSVSSSEVKTTHSSTKSKAVSSTKSKAVSSTKSKVVSSTKSSVVSSTASSSTSSSKSKNDAVMIGRSLITLIAALFI